jgi:hypothetical protein
VQGRRVGYVASAPGAEKELLAGAVHFLKEQNLLAPFSGAPGSHHTGWSAANNDKVVIIHFSCFVFRILSLRIKVVLTGFVL